MAEYRGIKAILRQFYLKIKASLDGKQDKLTIPLPVESGGTGADSGQSAFDNIASGVRTSSNPADAETMLLHSTSWYKTTVADFWSYIKSKIADGVDKITFNRAIEGITQTIDLSASSYDRAKYYPCTLGLNTDRYADIKVDVALNSGTKPSWSTHSQGFSVHFHIRTIGCGWGINSVGLNVFENSYNWADKNPVSWSQMTNGSVGVLWLRGGGKYFIRMNNTGNNFTVQTGTYTNNSQSVSPQATPPSFSTTLDARNASTATNSTQWGGKTLRLNHNTTDTWIPVFSNGNVDYILKTEIVPNFATRAYKIRNSAPASPENGDIWIE